MVRPDHVDDQRIAEQLATGSEQGITDLLSDYGGRVAGYLRRRFPSLEDSEVHDALVDAVIGVSQSFDPARGSLASWLLLLAHQAAVDRLRSRQNSLRPRSLAAGGEQAAATESPLEVMIQEEHYQAVRSAMQGLSDLERAVVEADLEVQGAAAAEELARLLDTTPDSVYAARSRARRKLAERLAHVFMSEMW